MTVHQQTKPRPLNPLDSIAGFLGLLFVAGVVGVWIGISSLGADILRMPAWAWDFAMVASIAAAGALRLAVSVGAKEDALSAAKTCGFLLTGGLGVFFLTGFFGSSAGGAPGTLGDALGEMIPVLARGIAWGTLVGVPGLAFVAISWIAVEAWRGRHDDKTATILKLSGSSGIGRQRHRAEAKISRLAAFHVFLFVVVACACGVELLGLMGLFGDVGLFQAMEGYAIGAFIGILVCTIWTRFVMGEKLFP